MSWTRFFQYKAAIWTGSHSHLFQREALRQYPVAVVNNQFYFDVKRQARTRRQQSRVFSGTGANDYRRATTES